jgi:hypothetical protein
MKCLFNPTEEERIEREPLLKYSFYLSSKNNLLLDVLDEIFKKLDTGFSEKSIYADIVSDASVLTWFWTLGAYEMIRTMAKTKDCFSANINEKINALKQALAKARMPSSKMEKKGQKIPVNSNRNFDGWDIPQKDLFIGDPDSPISARELFVLYDSTMSSITKQDVLKKHEQSNVYAKN